jgi:hypothetical protein
LEHRRKSASRSGAAVNLILPADDKVTTVERKT